MNCYSLTDGNVQEGIPADSFPLSADPAGDIIRQAVIDVEVDTPVEEFLRKSAMVTYAEPFLFVYGIALIRPLDGLPGKTRKRALRKIEPYMPDGSLLVSVDLARVYGDKKFGDHSLLVSWEGSRGLMLCLAGATALLDGPTNRLFINRAGTLLEEPRKQEMLKTYERKQRRLRIEAGRTRMLSTPE